MGNFTVVYHETSNLFIPCCHGHYHVFLFVHYSESFKTSLLVGNRSFAGNLNLFPGKVEFPWFKQTDVSLQNFPGKLLQFYDAFSGSSVVKSEKKCWCHPGLSQPWRQIYNREPALPESWSYKDVGIYQADTIGSIMGNVWPSMSHKIDKNSRMMQYWKMHICSCGWIHTTNGGPLINKWWECAMVCWNVPAKTRKRNTVS